MARKLRVCVIYDCLFPWTVGGHERWLRQLAESLAGSGHEVTFLTRLQWRIEEPPDVPGVQVVAVSKLEPLYGPDGSRRNGEAVRFGIGVFRHLLRHRRDYDIVHTCAFPYFHIPALRLALIGTGIPVSVDWPEVWSKDYWLRYSGRIGGAIGIAVQGLCVQLTPRAVVYSRTHGERLRGWGLRREPVSPGGLGPDPAAVSPRIELSDVPVVVFAGRHIREKRAGLVIEAVAVLRETVPAVRALVLGDGPESPAVRSLAMTAGEWAQAPGFVSRERVEREIRNGAVFLLPSEREGFGIVVLEAASVGTPVVVIAGPDNAATELIVPGVNGFVAMDASPATVAAALAAAIGGGAALRQSTADWYAESAGRLSASRTASALASTFAASATSHLA